jgi:hypothetical protein
MNAIVDPKIARHNKEIRLRPVRSTASNDSFSNTATRGKKKKIPSKF